MTPVYRARCDVCGGTPVLLPPRPATRWRPYAARAEWVYKDHLLTSPGGTRCPGSHQPVPTDLIPEETTCT